MSAELQSFTADYLTAPEAAPEGETVEQLEIRLYQWITKLVNEHERVLFTWRRLRQEVLSEYRRGKKNFAVHRTLNVFGANPKLHWAVICSQVRFDDVYREGIVLRKAWPTGTGVPVPLSWVANDILSSLCDDVQLSHLVQMHTVPMGHIANLAIASVNKSVPDTKAQQSRRELRRDTRSYTAICNPGSIELEERGVKANG